MVRVCLTALFALVFVVGSVLAADFKGKVKKVEKDSVTVTTSDGDKTFKLNNDTKYENEKGKAMKKAPTLKEGDEITVTAEKEGEAATTVKVAGKKKDKDK